MFIIQMRRKLNINTLLLIIFLVGVGFYFIGTPRTGDDYDYLFLFKPWLDSQQELSFEGGPALLSNGGNIIKYGFPVEELLQTWQDRFETNNIRLGNMIAPIFLILPRWVGPLISLLMIFFIIRISLRLVRIDSDSSPLLPIFLGCFTILIWCGDKLNEFDFQANYIWSLFIAVILLRHLWGESLKLLPSAILGFILGCWHEGLAFPVLVGLGTMCVLFRECRNSKYYVAMFAIALGCGVLCLSPGMQSRIESVNHSDVFSFIYLKVVISESIWFWMALALAVIVAIRVGWRRVFTDRMIVFLMVSGVVSFKTLYRTSIVYRAGFWMYFSAALLTIYLISIGSPNFWRRYNWKNLSIGIPLLLLVYTQWGYVAYYSLYYNRVVSEQVKLWLKHPGETRFAAVIPLQEMPLMCGNLPVARYGLCSYFDWITNYYKPDEEKRLGRDLTCYESMSSLIPERLRDVTATSGRAMPGGSPVREYKGLLYMPETGVITAGLKSDDLSRGYSHFSFDYGKGYVGLVSLVTSFISEADGKRYCYLEPQVSWYITHFKHVKRISPEISYIPGT